MANKIYQARENWVKWADSGGDATITLASLGTNAGRNGALHDFGDVSRAREYVWLFFCKWATAPAVGDIVRIYWREAGEDTGAVHPSNDDGTGDVALSSTDKLRNLQLLGTLQADEAATGVEMAVYGTLWVKTTHGGPVIYNDSDGDTLSSTAADNGFWIRPIPLEVQ